MIVWIWLYQSSFEAFIFIWDSLPFWTLGSQDVHYHGDNDTEIIDYHKISFEDKYTEIFGLLENCGDGLEDSEGWCKLKSSASLP